MPVLYGQHITTDLTKDFITLEYSREDQSSSDHYIILPQNSYQKIELHHCITAENETVDLSGLDISPNPVSLQYKGQVHLFHLFQIQVRTDIQHSEHRYIADTLKYSIHFTGPVTLEERPFNTYMLPFFEQHLVNPEHLPYFSRQNTISKDTQTRLDFFDREGSFFFFRQNPGFYEVKLNDLQNEYSELAGKSPLFFDHDLQPVPSYLYSNRAIFYQPQYEDEFTNKSVVWMFFPKEKVQKRTDFPVKTDHFNYDSEERDHYLRTLTLDSTRDYYFPNQNPDALPDARDAILHHLHSTEYSQTIRMSFPERSTVQPDTIPLELTLANPHKISNVNYRFIWNDFEIGRLENTNRTEEIHLELSIPEPAFAGITNHTLTIINEDTPDNGLFLTDMNVQYNARLQVRNPSVINTSLQKDGLHFRFPTIYEDYPLVFYKTNDTVYRYLYHFNERYNYAGERLITVKLPPITEERGTFYFFPRNQVQPSVPQHFNPSLSAIREESQVLLIGHPDFASAAEEYMQIHEEYDIGHYNIKDLYLIFRGGLQTPLAIKDFLSYKLLSAREIIPEFTVLFGDCTNDYKNRLGTDIKNYVPTMRYYRGQEGFASDYMLASLLGEGFFNDIIIARIPFNTLEDFENYLDKARHYKEHREFDDWNHRIAYLADDEGFDDYCEKLYEDIPPVFETDKIYLKNYYLEDNFYIPWEVAYRERIKVSPDCTKDIIELIQDGVAFSQYMGHGAPNILSHQRILFGGNSSNSDFLNLTPNYRPTFMSMMTCSTGAIDYPLPPWNINISEDFLRTPGSGAIGLFVPSGKGYPTQHMALSRILQDYIFRDNIRNLGAIVSNTLNSYYLQEKNEFHTAMYLLLGDPLLNLHLPDIEHSINISPAKTGKGSSSPLQISHPFSSDNGTLYSSLRRRDFFEKELELDSTLNVPSEEGQYFLVSRENNNVRYGTFEVIDYSPSISSFRLKESPQPGSNTFEFILSNSSDIDWHQLDINFKIVDVISGEVKQMQKSLDHLLGNSEKLLDFPVHLDTGIYETFLSLDISNYNAYTDSRRWFIPFSSSEEKEKLMITPQPGSQITKSGDISLQLRLFNPTSKPVRDIPIVMTVECPETSYLQEQTFTIEPEKEEVWNIKDKLSPSSNNNHEKLKISFNSPEISIIPEIIEIPLVRSAYLELASPMNISPSSPFEGQSLFFEIDVINTGDRSSSQALVKFFEESEGEEPRALPVSPNAFIKPLEPGETRTYRYRYSPWKNQGERTYRVIIDENLGHFDPQYSSIDKYVRKNFEFITHRARTVGPQTEEDQEERAVYLQAIFSNKGERDAHGVVVNFFRSSAQTPDNKIGEIYIDTVEAEKTYAVSHRWPDVPQGFVSWTYNVGLKVSTARVSYLGEAEHEPEVMETLPE